MSEDAKEIAVGKRFCSRSVLCTGERGQGVASVPGAIFDLWSSGQSGGRSLLGLYIKIFLKIVVVLVLVVVLRPLLIL